MAKITEAEARAALLQELSEASNPEYFRAERRAHGWVFGWRRDRGEAPAGTASWIVPDSGKARRLGPRESLDEALADEAAG